MEFDQGQSSKAPISMVEMGLQVLTLPPSAELAPLTSVDIGSLVWSLSDQLQDSRLQLLLYDVRLDISSQLKKYAREDNAMGVAVPGPPFQL